MPSDAKKIALLVSASLDVAPCGAARAPAGNTTKETSKSTENKRSRATLFWTLLRRTGRELSIINLLGKRIYVPTASMGRCAAAPRRTLRDVLPITFTFLQLSIKV